MKWLGIGFILIAFWIAYELWRAPLMQETEDGKLITKRPTKKLSDLFKKNNKNKQLWMSNLQIASQNH